MQVVHFFDEMGTDQRLLAGGKGGALALLHEKGYPVPNGFVIAPAAFENDELTAEARAHVQASLGRMREGSRPVSFAVRSSALSEDSSTASFAGQFKTVLDLATDDEVLGAIHVVRQSRHSQEVRVYSEARGISASHDMAVVVQQLARADVSGVMFTANPLTGSRGEMTGNFIFGLGEQLVSGQADPNAFTLRPPTRPWHACRYDGPRDLERFAGKLYELGGRLERELGCPQDIEWAIAGGKLYLLQSRPITTLVGHNPATGEWNDSATGDYLWSNVNFGEAVSEVMTPLSWSVLQLVFESWKVLPGHNSSGNIGGRPYLNMSVFASALHALGKSREETLQLLEGILYTRIPEGMDLPTIPLPRRSAVSILLCLVGMQIRQYRAIRGLPGFVASNPAWCRWMRERIRQAESRVELVSMWRDEIAPHLTSTVWTVMGSVSQFADHTTRLRRELTGLVGQNDADALISSLSARSGAGDGADLLASLGPVLGIARVARGEMGRDAYLAQYGHRGPNEFELSAPRPEEDPDWLERQLAQFRDSPVDVEALLARRRGEFDAAWKRFQARYPRQAQSMRRRIDGVAPRARLREAVRSEYVRDRSIARAFALRAGQMTGLEDGIFFLTIDEVLEVLSGDETVVQYIPARKETHRKYSALPAYPSIIRGRFDPVRWTADPQRRSDIYDASALISVGADGDGNAKGRRITGAAGSPGRFDGVVRRLDRPEEGDQLRAGEVLVTSQTDIAWTVLFPRAGAIVTDVGAPLSHAAIVARELGIPAVVGCGNATMCLRTGDRVLVDGGQGVVEVLD